MIGWLANTVKDLLGQPRLLSHKYKTLCSQVPAQLTILMFNPTPVSLRIHPLTLQSIREAQSGPSIYGFRF